MEADFKEKTTVVLLTKKNQVEFRNCGKTISGTSNRVENGACG